MAGNTRFHNKYHFAQHHSKKTSKNEKYPEATTDPLASEDFPFQGQFHSDGSLQIHPTESTDHNLIKNDTTLDGNLIVNKNTDIKGDLVVEGNVTLKADPFDGSQVIQIGNDIDNEFDIVKFIAFIDSDFVPDVTNQHDLGSKTRMWRRVYTHNLSLSGELVLGDCDEQPFRGMYINTEQNKPGGARLGINTCTPSQELHVVGDGLISENLTVNKNIEGQGNLWIHGNADIDGVVTLKSGNSVRWENDLTRVYGDSDSVTVDATSTMKINTPVQDFSNQIVSVTLKDSVNAYCVDNGTFGIDALNNRVGIGTCQPAKTLHVEGDVLANSGEIKLNATDKVEINGDNQVKLYSENDIHIESDSTSSWHAADSITIASPELVAIAGNMNWDLSKVDMTTQPVQFILRDSSTRSVQFGTCLLNLDGKNQRVGINTCEPLSGLHVKDDVLVEGTIKSTGDVEMVGDDGLFKFDRLTFDAGVTLFKGGNIGIGDTDPQHKLSFLCGDKIGTHAVQGNTTIDNHIIFCEGVDNSAGWDNMKISTAGSSDIVIKPGRAVQIPENVAIGGSLNNDYPESKLEVRGRTHMIGDLVIESYTSNGVGEDAMTLHSYKQYEIGTFTSRCGTLIGGDDNNVVIRIDNQFAPPGVLHPGFGIVYNDENFAPTTGLVYSSYEDNGDRVGFLGVNTSSHKFTDTVNKGGSGTIYNTNVHLSGFTVINGDAWVDENLHVNNDQTIDGRLDINCVGTDRQPEQNGLRILKGSLFITNDLTEEAKMILDTNVPKLPKLGADDLGSGSGTVSNLSSGQKEHLALDLRNTADETTFAVRYSGSNDGIADKIGLAMRPYNGEAHLGIGAIPSQNEHLHVFGNAKITGNLTVDGTETTLNTANLEIEDAHITLNKSENSPSTTNNLLSGGMWFQGDNNEIVGYVRVHDTDLSKLVAKAPTGQILEFDINGDQLSTIQLDESGLDLEHTTITTNDSNVTIDDAVVDINADLTVEAASFVDQDLTRDSTDVQFGDLDLTTSLNIPVGTFGTPSNIVDADLIDGYIRYNEDTDSYEASKNGLWLPIDKSHIIKDRDGDTFIEVHEDDNDTITTKVKDVQKMLIDEDGIDITAPVTIVSGDRKLAPMLKYAVGFTTTDIMTMPANLTVKGLGADAAEAPVATGPEMTNKEIIVGNKYVVVDHRGNNDVVIVQVYTSTGKMIIPDEIHVVNGHRVCIDVTSFPAFDGRVVISL